MPSLGTLPGPPFHVRTSEPPTQPHIELADDGNSEGEVENALTHHEPVNQVDPIEERPMPPPVTPARAPFEQPQEERRNPSNVVGRLRGTPVQSLVGRRAKIPHVRPYLRLRKHKIQSAGNESTEWYALASPGPLLYPPEPTVVIQPMQLFIHVDTSIVPNYLRYDGNDYDRFITMWIWGPTGHWDVIEAMCPRVIGDRNYTLKLNNCFEPAWVLRR
ncbi:hypothetical protein PQX77_002955 [Marasmius sp. AFHP31]|nr:hypothetical protein PQX77_002955 [Marasmius sp. AFHP31]